jgi:hypothetical protein
MRTRGVKMSFKKIIGAFAILGVLGAISACASKDDTCTSTSTDPKCKVGTDLGGDAGLLQIEFVDTFYFDLNQNSWVTIPSSDLKSGTVSTTIPVYATYLNLSANEATNSALAAQAQKSNAAITKSEVPYIEFTAKEGVRYIYRYQKISTSGITIADEQGVVTTSGARAIIPLVNASFNNKYYTAEATVGTRYKNVVQITAESNKKAGQVYEVQFQSVYSVQSVDFQVTYSDKMSAFTLANRWDFYNNDTHTGPNTKLDFVSLVDKKAIPTAVPVDARVLFKGAPRLLIQEEVFFELPFRGDLFKISGTVVPDRGNHFYVATIPLDSDRDFGMKVTLGGLELSKNSLAYQKLNFPVGAKLDVGFSYDLTPNAKYGPTAGGGDPFSNGLMYPLKPICYELKNQTYSPFAKESARDAVRAQGRYFAICDLDDTAEVSLDGPSTTRMDTWYDFFSYAPYRPELNELGHLYGIRSVTFTVETCLKVQIKASDDTVWQTKTQGGSNCGDSNSDDSWTYVTAQKSFTIFDNLSAYSAVKDLTSILSRFQNSSADPYSIMKFNNETLSADSIRHVY